MFKVVFHISDLEKWPALLSNVENLLRAIEENGVEDHSLVIIVNGPAVKGYLESEYSARIWELQRQGAHFDACNNSLSGQKIAKERLPECVEIVPAAVFALVEYQQKGYAYIKP